MRQLWWYKLLVTKQLLNKENSQLEYSFGTFPPILAGIYSFRNLKNGLFGDAASVAFNPGETPAEFIAASERKLSQFVENLLDPAQPFTRTDDAKGCEYCGFARLCGR